MNTKLLLKVKEQILKEPKQFEMRTWFTGEIRRTKIPNCGTAACIAGWAVALNRGITPQQAEWSVRSGLTDGRKVLRLTYDKAWRLFYKANWPREFRQVYAEGTPRFARNAAKRIDWFIKTGGRE